MERRVRDQDDDLGRAAPPAQLGAAQQNLADSIIRGSLRDFFLGH